MPNTKITIQQIDSKKEWEKALSNFPESNFLQSWNWGVFQQAMGKNVYPLHIYRNGKLCGVALSVIEKAKRGNYMTIAGGPLLNWQSKDANITFSKLLHYLKVIAKKEKVNFIRLRLQEKENEVLKSLMKSCGLQVAPMHLTADLTLQLDLSLSEDDLLKQMEKRTRYDVRKSIKEKIEIKFSQDVSEIDEFYKNQVEVAEKQGFIPFSHKFLKEQFKVFASDNQALLVHALKDGELLSTAFIIFYGNEAVYHYGISTEFNRKYPGSTACQWAAMLEAKKRGLRRYNFWGINPKDEPNHRFAGVGKFKRGFGGEEIQYLPAYDFPISWLYSAIRLFEFTRKKIRKL